jgi:uncharacterized protein (DUF1697 family)
MNSMTNYVAFLRGINVGGKNIIKMEVLRGEIEKMGFQDVRTFIQSGNVLFRSEMSDPAKIEDKIKGGLAARFTEEVKILVRSKKDMENTVSHFPEIFDDPDWKHNVIFLSRAVDSKNILARFELKKDIEQIHYAPGVLFWSAKRATITRSNMLKLSARPEYQEMTVRNANTARKILALMNEE